MKKLIIGILIVLSGDVLASSEISKSICAQTLLLLHNNYQLRNVEAKSFGAEGLLCAGAGVLIERKHSKTTVNNNVQKFALVFPRPMKFTSLTKEEVAVLSNLRFSQPEVINIGNKG